METHRPGEKNTGRIDAAVIISNFSYMYMVTLYVYVSPIVTRAHVDVNVHLALSRALSSKEKLSLTFCRKRQSNVRRRKKGTLPRDLPRQ